MKITTENEDLKKKSSEPTIKAWKNQMKRMLSRQIPCTKVKSRSGKLSKQSHNPQGNSNSYQKPSKNLPMALGQVLLDIQRRVNMLATQTIK